MKWLECGSGWPSITRMRVMGFQPVARKNVSSGEEPGWGVGVTPEEPQAPRMIRCDRTIGSSPDREPDKVESSTRNLRCLRTFAGVHFGSRTGGSFGWKADVTTRHLPSTEHMQSDLAYFADRASQELSAALQAWHPEATRQHTMDGRKRTQILSRTRMGLRRDVTFRLNQ